MSWIEPTLLKGQHGQPVVAEERVRHVYLTPIQTTPTAGNVSEVPPVHTLPRLCESVGQQYLQSTLLLPQYQWWCPPYQHGIYLPVDAVLVAADPAKRTRFCNSFRQWWVLPRNCPVFTMVMVIYCYVQRIWKLLLPPIFCITTMITKNYIQVNNLINI